MPEIYPFRGWYYNQSLINDLSSVVTPPYDNIAAEDEQNYRDASEFNFIHLILNDAPGEARYPAAARVLADWTTRNILVRDETPALYLLAQTCRRDGREVTRTGVIAELQLEELGTGVLPHERTFPKHILDRYRLMETTSANLGQIFMSYRDPQRALGQVAAEQAGITPMLDFYLDNIHFQVWRITDLGAIDRIQTAVRRGPAIIADGHHRYKTALQFYHDHPNMAGADRVMVTLVNAYDPGMEILPIHRLVKEVTLPPARLRQELAERFRLTEFDSVANLADALETPATGQTRIGLHDCRNGASLLLERSAAPDTLDAVVLHGQILHDLLGIETGDSSAPDQVTYLRGTAILDHMDRHGRDYDLVALLRTPDLDLVFRLAEQGRVMPQKTTFFFPKVYSGLIIRRFN
ncbi:MAG: DUF1015 domain-containing protein [Candidatus Neomarinimicrobiota bacterium]